MKKNFERHENLAVPSLLDKVGAYYTQKVAENGPVPRGVDWNGHESQELRFEQLLKIVVGAPFSINDLGSGYGALLGYLRGKGLHVDYSGVDVSAEMIEFAHRIYGTSPGVRFSVASIPDRCADYTVASGIFNVKLDTPEKEWERYVLATLDGLDQASKRGFAFNCLTSYSDPDRVRSDLYYAMPGQMFDYCKRRFSRNVALLHDYGLYEFTILVRKAF